MKKILLLLFFGCYLNLQAQPWLKNLKDGPANFFETQKAFYEYWKDKPIEKGRGYKPFKRWEWYWESRVSKTGEFPSPSITWDAWQDYLSTHPEAAGGSSYKTQAGPNWTFKGPSTTPGYDKGLGRLNCMAFHPSSANTFWVGSPSGGLWKTTNGGNSWSTNTDLLPVLGVSDIAIDQANPNIMYIATGDGDLGSLSGLTGGAEGDTKSIGILKSTNGGSTWNSTGLNWNVTSAKLIRRLLINPNNPQILIAAASDGIWITSNAGTSWTNVQNGYFMDIEFKPTDPTIVYASTYNPNGGAEIWHSNSGGSTWNLIGTINTSTRINLEVTVNNPNLVDALCAAIDGGLDGLWYSTNSGITYNQYFTGTCNNNMLDWSYDASACGGQGTYDLAYAINPNNQNEIWLGGVNTWKTTDGGNTFTNTTMWTPNPVDNPNNTPVVHADFHYLTFHPLQANTLFACNDGGLYKTTNGGTSWTDLSNGLQISQIYRIGVAQTISEDVIIGLQDNGSRELYNNLWHERTGGDGMDCAIDYTDDLIQYASYAKGVIYATYDGWQTPETTISDNISNPAPEGAWVTPFTIDPTTASTIYAGYDVVYKSTDRGNNWTQVSPVLSSYIKLRSLAVAPSNSNYIYAASFDTLFLTTNGGTNWFFSNNLFGITPITYIAVSPTNPQHVYCTIGGYTSGQKVYKSTDAGTTWTNFSGTLPNLPVNCIVYETGSNDRMYIGTDVGVFYREASMNDWSVYNNGLPNVVVTDLEISYQDSKLWAGTFGRGLWNSDLASIPAPSVSFTANNTAICAGDCISFTDNSSNSPSSWSWSFPGANTSSSTSQNPSNICYPTPGTYNVSLTATNSTGSGNASQTGYIIVGNGPTTPVIQATPSPNFCQGGSATITVINPCTGCTFTWTPGGQTGASINTSTAGNFLVSASDNCGQTASSPVTITVFPSPAIPTISINGNMLFTTAASSYQWYLNGNPIPGATLQTYQPTQAGSYSVEIGDVNNCTSTSTPVVFTPTSLDTQLGNNGSILSLYPNPAKDYLEVVLIGRKETETLIILNVLGEIVREIKISPSGSESIFRINTSEIPSGNYLLGIQGESRHTFQKFGILR